MVKTVRIIPVKKDALAKMLVTGATTTVEDGIPEDHKVLYAFYYEARETLELTVEAEWGDVGTGVNGSVVTPTLKR